MVDETEKLKERITELEDSVSSLQKSLRRLASLIEPNPKYPYWHKLICLGITEEQKMNLEYILSYLTSRLNRDESTLQNNKTKTKRFPMILFSDELPSLEQTLEIVSVTLKIRQENIIKGILLSMYQQEMYMQLIEYLLPEETKR